MCLGVPGRVVRRLKNNEALVDFGGIKRVVDAILLPDVREGDLVIVHAGAIIGRIDEEAYGEMIRIYEELARMSEEESV